MDDRLERMRANPAAGWRISDVEAVCREHGTLCAPPRGDGSHYKIAHPAIAEKLTIPSRRPIKAVYIRNLPSRRPIKAVYIRNLVAFLDVVRAAK
jgi:hypothetical protein